MCVICFYCVDTVFNNLNFKNCCCVSKTLTASVGVSKTFASDYSKASASLASSSASNLAASSSSAANLASSANLAASSAANKLAISLVTLIVLKTF